VRRRDFVALVVSAAPLCSGTATSDAARRISQADDIRGSYRCVPARSPRARLCRRAEYNAGGALGGGRQSTASGARSRARRAQTGCDRDQQRAGDPCREGGRHHSDRHGGRRRRGGARFRTKPLSPRRQSDCQTDPLHRRPRQALADAARNRGGPRLRGGAGRRRSQLRQLVPRTRCRCESAGSAAAADYRRRRERAGNRLLPR